MVSYCFSSLEKSYFYGFWRVDLHGISTVPPGTRKGLYVAIPSRRCSSEGFQKRKIIRMTWGRSPSSYAKIFNKVTSNVLEYMILGGCTRLFFVSCVIFKALWSENATTETDIDTFLAWWQNESFWITPAGSSWQWAIKFFVGTSDYDAQDHNRTLLGCQEELDSEKAMYGDIVELQTVPESYMTLKNKTASMIAFGAYSVYPVFHWTRCCFQTQLDESTCILSWMFNGDNNSRKQV